MRHAQLDSDWCLQRWLMFQELRSPELLVGHARSPGFHLSCVLSSSTGIGACRAGWRRSECCVHQSCSSGMRTAQASASAAYCAAACLSGMTRLGLVPAALACISSAAFTRAARRACAQPRLRHRLLLPQSQTAQLRATRTRREQRETRQRAPLRAAAANAIPRP